LNCNISQRLEDLSEILFAKNTTVYDTSFSPDGDVLAAISQGIGEPVVWRMWRLLEGKWELFKSGSFSNVSAPLSILFCILILIWYIICIQTPIRHTPTFIPFSLLPGMLILEDGEMMLLGKGPDQRDSINHIGNLTNVVRIVLSHQNQDPKLLAITNPTIWRKPGEVWRTTVADNRTRIPPTKVATVHESLTAETAVVLPPDESVIMISHKSSFIERVHFQS
jgi:hypothetical protein